MRSKEYLENISPSEEIIDFAWDESTRRDRSDEIKTSKNPVGYVLGGQPFRRSTRSR